MSKTSKQVHKEWAEKNNKFKQESYKSHVINSLSEADMEVLKLLESVDKASGGQLNKLVSAYNFIKNSQ